MLATHLEPLHDPQLHDATRARKLKRQIAQARTDGALRDQPTLIRDRLGPFLEILRWYRSPPDTIGPLNGPLPARLASVRHEVEALERAAYALTHRDHQEGAAIRRALIFLRDFGHLSSLDFELIPPEERPMLVTLLSLEYRWCFAAAGTTQRAFKIAIGRTGAR